MIELWALITLLAIMGVARAAHVVFNQEGEEDTREDSAFDSVPEHTTEQARQDDGWLE